MYNFYSINTNDTRFISDILDLFLRYRPVLLDDYYNNEPKELYNEVLDLIDSLAPHFYAITRNDIFIGFVYLYDWKGGKNKYHSCMLTTCFKRKYWGQDVRDSARVFLREIIKYYGFRKLKCEVFAHNSRVIKLLEELGFSEEGLLKGETLVSDCLVDVKVLGLVC